MWIYLNFQCGCSVFSLQWMGIFAYYPLSFFNCLQRTPIMSEKLRRWRWTGSRALLAFWEILWCSNVWELLQKPFEKGLLTYQIRKHYWQAKVEMLSYIWEMEAHACQLLLERTERTAGKQFSMVHTKPLISTSYPVPSHQMNRSAPTLIFIRNENLFFCVCTTSIVFMLSLSCSKTSFQHVIPSWSAYTLVLLWHKWNVTQVRTMYCFMFVFYLLIYCSGKASSYR